MNPASRSSHSLATRLTLIANLGGLMFGYDTAVISGAVDSIDRYFIAPLALSETARDTLSGFTISSALIGCVIGAAMAGWAADRSGRRKTLMLAAVLFIVSSIGAALPEIGFGAIGAAGPAALPAFILYRILGGVGIGIASMVSPMYIAEIAPGAIRGRLVSYNQMAIVVGIVGVYFVNWAIAGAGDDAWVHAVGWRLMLASAALPAALLLLLLLRADDSPRWLVLKARDDEARSLLVRLAGEVEADRALAEIRQSLVQHTQPLLHFGAGVVIIGVLLSVFQQAVGINAVLYYAPLIFRNMGAGGQTALLQTVLVGVVNLLATVLAIFTVDRWGRKPLLVLGGFVMAAAMAALSICFASQALGIGALLAMLVYVAGFALSWGPVTWVLLAEIFPNSIKGRALSLAVAAQWLANIAVSWSFRLFDGNSRLIAHFHHGFPYALYAAISLFAAIFVLRCVPETKGRSLESVASLWKRRD
ncbi:D-xylose transporter XylE [Solimonas terrae]|uniref:D-xylose-proton symporter n=1 Tax=Solimonas terrae TaxID=1396819 RepID=A0A6M2BLE5_9GAMM|nr:D-xylose transporter XylE [Solimonas terrae]NGY03308.1 D-xylose transporter XylE [Solimonas terrae]